MPLPDDRLTLQVTEAYRKYVPCYYRYLKMEPTMGPVPANTLVPPEWETVYSTTNDERPMAVEKILRAEALKPRLNLRENINVHIVPSDEEALMMAVMRFSDTAPSATCPWYELAVTTRTVFLSSLDGVLFFERIWRPLIDPKSGEPIYAFQIYASSTSLFVQSEENGPWREFHETGVRDLDLTVPLVDVFPNVLATSNELRHDPPSAFDLLPGHTFGCSPC
jgi:hypothetical protein